MSALFLTSVTQFAFQRAKLTLYQIVSSGRKERTGFTAAEFLLPTICPQLPAGGPRANIFGGRHYQWYGLTTVLAT